jgi:hypothetical protein
MPPPVHWCHRILRSRLTFFVHLYEDRGAAIAIAFAIGAVVFIGMAGIATEVGAWYLTRRQADNAADAAALAGALALAASADPLAAATNLATQNGFSNGGDVTVTISHPPTTGPYAGNSNAVEVSITKKQPLLISALFLSSEVIVQGRAVALMGSLCGLALTGDLVASGVIAPNCLLASNATGSTAISVTPPISALLLYSAGGCTGCAGLRYYTSQPSIADPAPAPSIPVCLAGPQMICSGSLSGNLAYGKTYYLGGTAHLNDVTCHDCSFVVFGSASVNIAGTADIRAPVVNTTDAALNGVAIYQSGSGATNIAGGFFAGALYFPNASVTLSNTTPSTCTIVVAQSLSLNAAALDVSGCATYGTPTAVPQARLVDWR